MADVKISNLPAATQANMTDLLAKVDAVGPTTQKLTVLQFANLLGLGSGKVNFVNSTGAANFASGLIQFASDGSAVYVGDIEISTNDGGIILSSSGGFRWRITVDDAGQLNTNPAP